MRTHNELKHQNHRSKIALALMLALLIALVGGAVIRVWPLAQGALAQDVDSNPSAARGLLQITPPMPTIPPPPDNLTMDLQVGPNPFCPSYRLHYNLTLTNTTGVRLDDLVITASLPIDTYNPVDGGSTVAGVLTPDQKAMVWEQGSVGPGEVIRSYVIVRSYSTAPAGTVLTTTFTITSPNLSAKGEIAGGVTANPAVCPPPTATPTLTPSPTPTTAPPDPTPTTPAPDPTPTTTPPGPTPDPTVPPPTPEPWMFLPLVTNGWTL
jgi:hypothetical protein